ncbi:MAG: vWA domain-containing protein [Kiritimatiellia bacterium]
MPALTVLNPIFVWMLPAAALPVLFHLFFRVRKRERLFSTLMFFRRADPRLRSRRRIREWLTLLLRVFAIVFLLLALARPCWQGLGRGAAVSTVLVVDNSGSMSGQSPKGPTKLALACEAARNLVLRMHNNDKAGIVLLVNDPTVGLPEGMTSDRTALAAALNDIRPTDASGKPAHALDRAVALLNLAPSPHRELHIFTDIQVTEWGKEAALSGAVPFGVEVVVHRIPSSVSSGPDLAVKAIRPQQRRIVAGRPFSVLVEVLNQGNSDGRARLSTFDSNGAGSTQEILVPANQNRTVSLTLRAVNPRPQWLQVRIEDEGLPADNQAYLAFHPLGRQTVLFVGADREFGLLPLALAPDSEGSFSGLVPIFKERSHVRAQLDKINPAMIVVTWEEIADWAHPDSAVVELQTFVSKGGTLLLVPATAASTPSF